MIDAECKMDCQVWLDFLCHEDLRLVVNRPMLDFSENRSSSTEIGFFSDASASEFLGFGAIFGNRWIRGDWDPTFIKEKHPSIEYLELFALCVGVLTWHEDEKLRNANICLHCDNSAVVQMVNGFDTGWTKVQ